MYDVPNTNKKENITENVLLENNYNEVLLFNIEKLSKVIFPNNFTKELNYCGWLFPDGSVLNTEYSSHHGYFESQVTKVLDMDENYLFIKAGITRYNIQEGLIELGHNFIPTKEELKVLKEVLIKYYDDCTFIFGGGGNFLFADIKGKPHYIEKYEFEKEYPFEPIYKRTGEDIYLIIENYCNTGRVIESLDEVKKNEKTNI